MTLNIPVRDAIPISKRVHILLFSPKLNIDMSSLALITGWGYTEITRLIEPRPKTSAVLREAEVYILPQVIYLISCEHSTYPN